MGRSSLMRQRPFTSTLVGMVAASLLAGCALIQPQEAPRETYDLTAPADVRGDGSTSAQILVKLPTALKAIDSDRIVVKPSPTVITYLEGAQWQDSVPRMVQAKLVEAFENTSATGATAKPGDGLVIDYQLVIDIRRFEIAADGAAQAVIEISIKLLTDRTGQVRETRIFTATAPATGGPGAGYVAALDAAFDQLARDVVRWVTRAV